MTGKTVPYVQDFGSGTYEHDQVTLYFKDGSDIPYVALSEYMPLLSETLEKTSKRPGITYEVSPFTGMEHLYRVRRTDVESEMWFDTAANTIDLQNFNSFTQLASVTASVAIMDLPDPTNTDIFALIAEAMSLPEGEQGDYVLSRLKPNVEPESLFAAGAATISRGAKPITLELNDYLIDLVEQNGECFVPLQTMSDLFMNSQYLYFIYNEDTLYCIPYRNEALLEEVYQVPPKEMSAEFSLFNYNELRLMLDCMYGLKSDHNIEDFGTLLAHNTTLVSDLVSTDSGRFDDAVARLTSYYFDDGHSAFLKNSWRTPQNPDIPDFKPYMGTAVGRFSTLQNRYQKARHQAYPDGIPMYQEIGDTAFITFDVFKAADDFSTYYHMEPLNPADLVLSTISMDEALAQMLMDTPAEGTADPNAADTMFDPTAEENIVDTIALLIYARQQITREGSPVKNVVVDLSCSGGGSCAVLPCTSASGTVFQISGTSQLSTVQNGSFYNIDQGIEPDVVLTKVESFYDREALVDMIHNLR